MIKLLNTDKKFLSSIPNTKEGFNIFRHEVTNYDYVVRGLNPLQYSQLVKKLHKLTIKWVPQLTETSVSYMKFKGVI